MKIVKKRMSALSIVFGVMLLLAVTASFGAVTHNVTKTAHNLGATTAGSFRTTDTSEVCIFCHTPHNAVSGQRFLWNRINNPVTFALYTASSTLNFTKGVSISDVSKMCMSCHDGVTAMNSMANPTPPYNFPVGGQAIGDVWNDPFGTGEWGPNIGQGTGGSGGGNLTNDHPISFEYRTAIDGGDNTIRTPDGGITGTTVGAATSGGALPLWSDASGKYRLECVTCHDPHIDYGYPAGRNTPTADIDWSKANLRPFLRKSNSSSNLCYTCHLK